MIQISLTTDQLKLIKDTLDSFDEGYLETEHECQEFRHLKQFINYKMNEPQQVSDYRTILRHPIHQ